MKRCMSAVALLTLASSASANEVTPIQKVLQLMKNMKAKGLAEMDKEKVQFAQYKQFCTMTLEEKKATITEAKDKIEQLDAKVEKNAQDADDLAYEVTLHKKELESASAEQAEATKVRKDERAVYQTTLKDYSESIDAVNRALPALKKQAFDRKQAESLIQLSSSKVVPEDAKKMIRSFLQTDSDSGVDSDYLGTPEAAAYEFQSGGVVTMLENLQTDFTKKRVKLEKDEAAAQQAFTMLVQGLENQQRQLKKSINEKDQFKAKKLQTKAEAEADMSETKSLLASDTKYRNDLQATCEKKEADFKVRTHTRNEEIDAIEKAMEIIDSPDVAGKEPARFLQEKSATTFASLRSHRSGKTAEPQSIRAQLMALLQNKAKVHNSRLLSQIASSVSNAAPTDDAMFKVANMIQGLITKLNEEAQKEATQKGYCDKELKTNELTRTEKSAALESITADLDDAKSTIVSLGEDIAAATKEITELNVAMKTATQLRQKEKLNNTATIKDASTAQRAVASAITVLNEFYAKASGAEAFVQVSEKTRSFHRQPEIFDDTPYTGMGSSSGGVVGMLEIIQSDFARLMTETQTEEKAAAAEFSSFMEDSRVDKAKKTKDVEHKGAKKSEKQQLATQLEQDLLAVQKEYDAAMFYYDKLKPQCINTEASYEEKQEQRKKEIEDLTAALELLESLA
eukprot:TRINITY_DN4908_c0_g1_i1.p1 TRINITY_DN4908_c0_g1~~TRINITY_DN4908_c0_g1_i1.p1  ORF type:complete len:683 (+),score=229.75 TRINITY_DN4908_c0_g1_i1:104-2152(+)